jgi:uracil-DNA glycosylase
MCTVTPDRTKAARELLAFYLEAGVDGFLSEEPVNHFAPDTDVPTAAPTGSTADVPRQLSPRPPRQPVKAELGGTSVPTAPAVTLSSDQAVMAARDAARNAANLDELRGILNSFEGCALRVTAKQLVFADGNPQARVMFVGEAPGRDEDLAGVPFVGRSGKLLDRMLAAIGLDRSSAYIANIIPWRPPGNRTPTPQESQICLPFILRQIELANPDVLVCLGGPSSQALLGFTDGIRRTRGRWLNFHTGTREIRAIATFHPAYLLRSPLEKRLAWRDFLAVKQALAGA